MIDAIRARELLSYDGNSGVFTWKKDSAVAGCKTPYGYVLIGVDGALYLAHRLAWLWVTGNWPAVLIDHKNRIRDDNRWDNLREANKAQNAANSLVRSTSKSGIKGVSWCKATRKWRATITVNGKQRSLGRHTRVEAAAEAYRNAELAEFGEFAAAHLGVTFVDLADREKGGQV